jgi:hypothetical protein
MSGGKADAATGEEDQLLEPGRAASAAIPAALPNRAACRQRKNPQRRKYRDATACSVLDIAGLRIARLGGAGGIPSRHALRLDLGQLFAAQGRNRDCGKDTLTRT